MQLGDRIRQLREQRKLGVSDFAAQVGLSADDVSQIEANQRQLSSQEVTAFARVLQVNVDELFQSDSEESEGSSVLIPTDRLNKLLDEMKNK